MKTKIDYYGNSDNYIHLKFGDARKMYNFTDSFIKEYPRFAEEYERYWNKEESLFNNAYSIIKYVQDFKIPVNLYFNFTDKPATTKQAIKWWIENNTISKEFTASNLY